MPKTVKLRTLDQNGENEEVVELTFEDKDWEILEDFARYAAQLEEKSLVKEGIPAALNVSWTEEQGLKVEAKLPSDDSIESLLVRLRPFLLMDESTNFNKVRNILAKATSNKRIRRHLDTLQFLYSGERLQSLFVAGAYSPEHPEPQVINSETMFQTWLNGHLFHKNKEKQKVFDAMHAIMPQESTMALFMFLVTDKVAAILALRQIISLLAGERETIFAEIILEEPIHYIVYLHPSFSMFNFFDLDEQEPRPLPKEGEPFALRVFDLTNLGPASLFQFINLAGELWLRGEMIAEIGERHYFFRVAKGFTTPDGKVSQNGTDIIATVKVQALLTEDPFYYARRKPAQATLERMKRESEGATSSKVVLKSFDNKEELDRYLERDPKPEVEWVVVPRVAFQFAYWPISKQANERFHKIRSEGREPTFEEVEGDVSKAWEIFEQDTGESSEE